MPVTSLIRAQFVKRLADAIIWGRDAGIDVAVMESGFSHAWMHVYLLGMTDTPPLPAGPWATLAKEFATQRHAGQSRRDGQPYISHPEAVAAKFESDDSLQAIAWLHDVVEDTDVTSDELSAAFPAEIVSAVMALTKQEGQAYENYLEQVAANPLARQVKIADMRHNLGDAPTPGQISRYTAGLKYLAETHPDENHAT